MDDIEFVKTHYKEVAKEYLEIKDSTQADIPLFRSFLGKVNNILELGCASGFPIAEAILSKGKQYRGIDLSPEQIKLAHQRYPEWKVNFQVSEMLTFVQNQPDLQFDGIVSMFSIRHLPRVHHANLYFHLYRLLIPSGYLLIDHTKNPHDGRGHWFDNKPMYWSGFSKDWQKLTLQELGFVLIEEFEDTKTFLGEEEKTLFALYQKQ